jgi:hypothetical protein
MSSFTILEAKMQKMQDDWELSAKTVSESAKSCEEICNRLSNDILTRMLAIETKVKDLEDNFNNYLTMIESSSLPSATKEQAKSKIDMALIEKKLNSRISDSLDNIGKMCKTYLNEQIDIENRIQKLEQLKAKKETKLRQNQSFNS